MSALKVPRLPPPDNSRALSAVVFCTHGISFFFQAPEVVHLHPRLPEARRGSVAELRERAIVACFIDFMPQTRQMEKRT